VGVCGRVAITQDAAAITNAAVAAALAGLSHLSTPVRRESGPNRSSA
jgi:hypothetical protein